MLAYGSIDRACNVAPLPAGLCHFICVLPNYVLFYHKTNRHRHMGLILQ